MDLPSEMFDKIKISSNNHLTADSQDQKTQPTPNISVHKFSTKVMDCPVFYQITKFGTTIFIWMGGTDGHLKDLVYASATPYDKGKTPSSTKLLGNVSETLSTSLAIKLTQKLKKPVYVSYNLPTVNEISGQDVLSRLMEEIAIFPEKF